MVKDSRCRELVSKDGASSMAYHTVWTAQGSSCQRTCACCTEMLPKHSNWPVSCLCGFTFHGFHQIRCLFSEQSPFQGKQDSWLDSREAEGVCRWTDKFTMSCSWIIYYSFSTVDLAWSAPAKLQWQTTRKSSSRGGNSQRPLKTYRLSSSSFLLSLCNLSSPSFPHLFCG